LHRLQLITLRALASLLFQFTGAGLGVCGSKIISECHKKNRQTLHNPI
jgi:hypothetical protein